MDYKQFKLILIIYLPVLGIILALLYIMARTFLFIIFDYPWYEKTLAFFLLLAEAFITMHGIGYFLEIFYVINHRKSLIFSEDSPPSIKSYPPVAVIVSSFREPLEVVKNTLISFYNLTYPNKHIYFLDDTRYDLPGDDPKEMQVYKEEINQLCQHIGVNLFRRKWRGAKAGMINDFLDFIEGESREGFEFYNYAEAERKEKEKYIVVFDADQNPFPKFLEPLVSRMEANPKLAFIQTPQYYTNFESNRIARAAGLQQAIFYEYICEGKSIKDAMFCCGTNVIFSREALSNVGGFDEASVTEDFATSLKFHLKGWRSAYFNEALAFGMGPEDLGGYFKQQFRWAIGTVGLLRQIVKHFLKNPKSLSFTQWWEYFLSSTHYFIGLVFFILVICPIIYLFLNIPSYFAKPEIYILFYFPYIIMTLFIFFWTLKNRKYHIKDVVTGQLLMVITFPVYMKAAVLALLGVKGSFVITPKGGSNELPLRSIWIQLVMATIGFSAIVWGTNRLIYEYEPFWAILTNMFWCVYHLLILLSIFYFNSSE
ncbi:MAG: glycosyltransferase family 2 protein [Thermodesulfobacteriota bacterium]|nr:glycosyltransferase family 2 protein [Thermodesulfobacteriota bacterium]